MAGNHHIAVTLFHRDHLSQGRSREILGNSSYHWGLAVLPPSDDSSCSDAYDATDASEIDQTTWRMSNPTMDWWLRIRPEVDLDDDAKFLGFILLGDVPDVVSDADLKQIIQQVPLPKKNTHPQESCVTWVFEAISAFQGKGWVQKFDDQEFGNFVLSYADERLSGKDIRKLVKYPAVRE